MNDPMLIIAMQQMLYYTVLAVCFITIPTLVIGIGLSIFQAATQINEMTLTFVPKFVLMFTLLFFLLPWLMEKLILITQSYLGNVMEYIR